MNNDIDDDGYPTDEALDKIIEWPGDDPKGLIDYIMDLWYYPEYATWADDEEETFLLHTGGWSGNESIIDALETTNFWLMHWYSTTRGGHYVFKLRG